MHARASERLASTRILPCSFGCRFLSIRADSGAVEGHVSGLDGCSHAEGTSKVASYHLVHLLFSDHHDLSFANHTYSPSRSFGHHLAIMRNEQRQFPGVVYLFAAVHATYDCEYGEWYRVCVRDGLSVSMGGVMHVFCFEEKNAFTRMLSCYSFFKFASHTSSTQPRLTGLRFDYSVIKFIDDRTLHYDT